MSGREKPTRRFTPPLGWPPRGRVLVYRTANRAPLVCLNRYPGQVIGIAFRLPDAAPGHHRCLSIVWAKAARWWSR